MTRLPMRSTAVGLALLTGMAAAAPAWAETELRITHSMTGGSVRDAFDIIVDKFEAANPDITINQIVFDDDLYSDTGLITQLQSNDVPDVYFQWGGFPVRRDAEAGYAMDLTDAMATDGWGESFVAASTSPGAGAMVDGVPYLVPISLDLTNTIWFNEGIFAEYGLTPPETWDEFVALTATLAAAGEVPIIEGNNELWPLGNWASHIASRVVPVDEYDAAFRVESPFNTAGWLRALELVDELQEAGAFNRDLQGLGADPAMAAFFQGVAAMHPIGSWLVSSAGDLGDEDFAYSQFDTPMIDPDHPLSTSVIGALTGFIVHDQSEHQDEAITFLRYFTSAEAQTVWIEVGANLSPVVGVNDMAEMGPVTRSVADLMSTAGSIVPPPDNTYPVPIAEAWYQAAAFVANGDKSPQEALNWLDETVAVITGK